MKPRNNQKFQIIKSFTKIPIWLKFIIVVSIISQLLTVVFELITIVRTIITGKTASQLSLRIYESQLNNFQIKLPYSWLPPAESIDGIGGDPNLILEYFNGNFNQSYYDIAKIELPDTDLSNIVDWEKKRAMDIPNTIINSNEQYDTALYSGTLLTYKIIKAGVFKEDLKCLDWITYNEPIGYSIRLCTEPNDWKKHEASFKETIESFSIK